MNRKHNLVIPTLLAALLAGCSGGSTTPGVSGTTPVLAATTGSATSYTSVKWGGGAYRWNPTTSSWTPITDGLGFGGGESAFHGAESIALDPNNDQLVYMVTGMYTLDGGGNPQNGRIYVSSNRGDTWTYYDLPFPVGGNENGRALGERLSVDPNKPSTLFYGSRSAGLWKSTDSGHTWSQVTSLASTVLTGAQIKAIGNAKGVESIIFDTSTKGTGTPTSTLYAAIAQDYASAAGLTSVFYKSTDAGTTWAPVSVPSAVSGYYIPHMVRASDGVIYVAFSAGAGPGVAGPGYLYKFSGGTWTLLASNSSAGYGGLSVYGSGATTRIVLGVSNTWGSGQLVQLADDAGNT
jgi:hypothetical protein